VYEKYKGGRSRLPVTITFPKQLSTESYQDLEDQLSLILRRVKRQSGKDEEAAN
jgi:hypothetical protein